MAVVTCPECGGKVSTMAPTCPHCGFAGHAETSARCAECEGEVTAQATSCPHCGAPQAAKTGGHRGAPDARVVRPAEVERPATVERARSEDGDVEGPRSSDAATIRVPRARAPSMSLEEAGPRDDGGRRPATDRRESGGVAVGIAWMFLVSMLLFFLPLLGPFIAGIVGGRKAGGVLNAIMAALVPSLAAASVLISLTSFLQHIPIVGALASVGAIALAFAGAGPLLVGAILGGAFSRHEGENVSVPAAVFVVVTSGFLGWRVYGQVSSAARAVSSVASAPLGQTAASVAERARSLLPSSAASLADRGRSLLQSVFGGGNRTIAAPSVSEPAATPPPAGPTDDAEPMKRSLRNLVTAQEAYFAENVTYAGSIGPLSFQSYPGVTIEIVNATGTGWSATARSVTSSSICSLFIGSAPSPVPGANEGAPTCTKAFTRNAPDAYSASSPPAQQWLIDYANPPGTLTFTVDGDRVEGTIYADRIPGGNRIEGTLTGSHLEFRRFSEADQTWQGDIDQSGMHITGTFSWPGGTQAWTATRR